MSGVINSKRAKHKYPNLETQIARKMWPTPRSAKGMAMKCTQGMADLQHKCYLETEVAYQEYGNGEYLNPTWVEWLMGMPIGWTSLEPLDKDSLSNWNNNIMVWRNTESVQRTINKKSVKELKALGNAQVPLQVATVWDLLNI